MASMLFAYGTLMPRDPGSVVREGWEADAVRGRLYDLGPYPALVDLEDPEAGWVEGYVRLDCPAELMPWFDAYEEVESGLYRRAEATTRCHRQVWVYIYNQPLPPHARGPLTRWTGRGMIGLPPSIETSQGDA